MTRLFALIDCNNFFVSCERVFQPELRQRPVIVLSSNDGCVISRSNEAKALGIKMGVPYFKIQALCKQHKVKIRSSNFGLYGDLSQRIIQVIHSFEPRIEQYSIDEVFVELTGTTLINVNAYLHHLVASIEKQVGIPVSLGVGQTKTLAKIAVFQAKKQLHQPVCVLGEDLSLFQALNHTPLSEVWGIGKRWSEKLTRQGISTAYELSQINPQQARQQFNIILANTIQELRGISCLDLDSVSSPRRNIISSRSFGKTQTDFFSIAEALSNYGARACEKLRAQRSLTKNIQVFLNTNRFAKNIPYYSRAAQVTLPQYTNDTATIVYYAKKGLSTIFKNGLAYQKAGIMLCDLISENTPIQYELFSTEDHLDKKNIDTRQRAQKTLDAINQRFGQDVLYLACQKLQHDNSWRVKKENCSPSFTTRWNELLVISKG
ncbi:MAG: Y-family DNA polymerase [Legionellales bacterium]|nr:Y-family DNA polymerase [Legionellales bacterium]